MCSHKTAVTSFRCLPYTKNAFRVFFSITFWCFDVSDVAVLFNFFFFRLFTWKLRDAYLFFCMFFHCRQWQFFLCFFFHSEWILRLNEQKHKLERKWFFRAFVVFLKKKDFFWSRKTRLNQLNSREWEIVNSAVLYSNRHRPSARTNKLHKINSKRIKNLV